MSNLPPVMPVTTPLALPTVATGDFEPLIMINSAVAVILALVEGEIIGAGRGHVKFGNGGAGQVPEPDAFVRSPCGSIQCQEQD